MKYAILALALGATPAIADGYSDHTGVALFTEAPCSEAIAAIDWLETAETPDTFSEESMERFTQGVAMAGMAWGVLLGIDLERSGLHAKGMTTLERLRKACSESADKTARAILEPNPPINRAIESVKGNPIKEEFLNKTN